MPVLLIALPLILTACAQKTELRFSNETSCGMATIVLTNVNTGNSKQYTVDEGHEITVGITPDQEYHYEVTYPRQPDFVTCESKRVTTQLPKGQTLNVRLDSVLDPTLEATLGATPATGELEAYRDIPFLSFPSKSPRPLCLSVHSFLFSWHLGSANVTSG